ncbi:response regulator transcription factor [Elizabethkingia meningoseptica]|uniref:DNA-binding response regulator n=1 Tax=Elizabethkingia meningoseptica TaxID=238 RepID=A0A1V3U4T5_ELIME|nr:MULTISPECIES: response regulator transcription factor [Elizabethkingia]AQX05332.1 DNA-binding response regulator [Elizabethkingia meningoseptica]AQX12897.1 DNA-binding response regulator [Elizabethkingia meningoseptica]AQX47374.1 two-component system response regulator [Elizabethkingia meningoseptica]EJK5329630.1 response regulator transcription factor [Elizabethkingia meningoseptica]EOR31166.1 LytTR family two component transcriptional regulator [Elizabethkingia meningoseptica ATCC 13253 =
MKIKCLIVDDEPLAIRLIEKHIAKIDNLEVVATCNTALKAFEILNLQKIDLMFLDIKMPNITGIEFLKNLKNPPKTILTTAYRDYAIEGYDLDVIDYLLKPITFERFFKAIDRFLSGAAKNELKNKDNVPDKFILIKSGIKNHKININDIVYIESLKDYIKINIADGRNITSKYKIGDIQEELHGSDFMRIHRSFIINTMKITAFTSNEIEVNTIEIPIGASYKENVLLYLQTLKGF